jgi:hypothetical protein
MEGTTSIKNELSDLEKYEAYLVYHRKSYDKHRDKILLKKKEAYVPPADPWSVQGKNVS